MAASAIGLELSQVLHGSSRLLILAAVKSLFRWFAILVASFPLLKAAPDKGRLKAELIRAEAAFCAMASTHGVQQAFAHFAAPDAAFIDTDPLNKRGLDAVRAHLAGTPSDLRLTWSPNVVEVSDDGTLGYTYGRYEAHFTDKDGHSQQRSGFYLTIWKRQPDGSWRYVMDTGAPDKPQAPTPSHSSPHSTRP